MTKAVTNLQIATGNTGTVITADASKPAPEFARMLHNLGHPEPTALELWVADCWARGVSVAGPAPARGEAS